MRSPFHSLTQFFWLLLTVIISLVGAWLASSIVAHTVKDHLWLNITAGVLLLPITPLFWQAYAERKIRRVGWKRRMPVLIDRALKRTLTLNLVLIAALLIFLPQLTFTSLSKRGDWMLGKATGEDIQWVRATLHKTVEEMKSFHKVTRKTLNTYIASSSTTEKFEKRWPWQSQRIHPAVAKMPSSVETSIASVAEYIANQESDPFLRVKALHDYVTDRIAYDAPAFFSGNIPPQDPEIIFKTRLAVCQGFAELLEALGKAIDQEIVTIPGDARTLTSDLGGQGHAWNAVKIDEQWYLIDATWDSGSIDSSGFTKNYRTDYLMLPPEVLIFSHFPDDLSWQLLDSPLSLERFQQQPALEPKFFAEGLRLVSPTRAQTDVRSLAEIEVNNPKHRWLLATYAPQGSSQREKCGLALLGSPSTSGNKISCLLPGTGIYEVSLFSSNIQFGQAYEYVGKFEFNRL